MQNINSPAEVFIDFLNTIPRDDPKRIVELAQAIDEERARALQQIVENVGLFLKWLSGQKFGDDTPAVAKAIQRSLVKLNLRLRCPRVLRGKKCGKPAVLYTYASGSDGKPAFALAHQLKGKVNPHATSRSFFENLELSEAPARRDSKT